VFADAAELAISVERVKVMEGRFADRKGAALVQKRHRFRLDSAELA
jgi:hypothetical protein